MKKMLVALLLAAVTASVYADEQADCAAAAGTLMTGVVVNGPEFKHGKPLKGTELSHTHLTIKSDQDGQEYAVAIDNVFAKGYDDAGDDVPAPLDSIAVNDRIELCGQPFPQGIHWVHTNCGKTPTSDKPDGWVKKIDADGNVGENLEDSREYCKLWEKQPRGKKHLAKK